MDKSDFLSIADIVGQYVQLTPEGDSHYLGKCPFCSSTEDSLILSRDTQYWHCVSCGAGGDRYDFVAKAEHISKAAAILAVGHHTVSGEPFPHARLKAAAPAAAPRPREPGRPAAMAPAPPSPPPEAPAATAVSGPAAPEGSAGKGLLAPFLQFRNIIPSYQGAAILDDKSKMIVFDSDYSLSAELGNIGEILAPILVHAGKVFSKSGSGAATPGTLTLTSQNVAILVHKFGPADESMLLVVRLANPSDEPVARRLVASASPRFT